MPKTVRKPFTDRTGKDIGHTHYLDSSMFGKISGWLGNYVSLLYPYLTYLEIVSLIKTSKGFYHLKIHIKKDIFRDRLWEMLTLATTYRWEYHYNKKPIEDDRKEILQGITNKDKNVVFGSTEYINKECCGGYHREKRYIYYLEKHTMIGDISILKKRWKDMCRSRMYRYDEYDEYIDNPYNLRYDRQRQLYYSIESYDAFINLIQMYDYRGYRTYINLNYDDAYYRDEFEEVTDNALLKAFGRKAVWWRN